ncbi:MAG: PilZ domain-containing protein [Myxococcales bacterium]|nr:PilZ domain-containing protein [Myxococcales bacterium]
MPNTPPQVRVGTGVRPERRTDRRAKLDRPVMIDTEAASRPGRALDVSRGGISIESELELAVGEVVQVYFELPIGYAVEARATVTRCEKNQIALRFVEMDHEAEVALRSFCRISGLHRLDKA